MKVSLITTVFNEEETIISFLNSIFKQTRLPDEIIIVDGGSKDQTLKRISEFNYSNVKNASSIKLIFKKGNRSVGRNEAITKTKNEIIAITDAGCILDKNWLKNLVKPFSEKKVDVVAGYYKGFAKNVFQKCLIPYVLVMEDKVADEEEFLPATRSMAITKSVWKKAGKFDEKLFHNEDYAFAHKLKKIGAKIVFCKDAIVNWTPRKNLRDAFIMFFRFAFGDAEAKIFRDKVIYIFLRYIFAAYLFTLSIVMRSYLLWGFYILLIFIYISWSIQKNYKYIKEIRAIVYLPLLQVTSDLAVITGTLVGLAKNVSLDKFLRLVLNNKGITLLIFSYVAVMLSVINWGIPNLSHPFAYHMDEWHQSQSVRDLFKYGTPNIAGAANGTIFQFFLAGIYLVPFFILGIINPFAVKSSVTNLDLQQRLFEIFRTNTLLFGVLSIILVYYLAKKYFKVNGFIAAFLFTVNPIWLMLSNYFKYDISLMFWILLSLLFLLRYIKDPKTINFVLAGFFSGLAFSVKVSAIPLLPICVFAFFLYTPDFISKLKRFLIGASIFIGTSIIFGIPDLIFAKGNLTEYLTSNLIDGPKMLTNNFNFGMNQWQYFLTRIYPLEFGGALYVFFAACLIFFVLLAFWKFKNHELKILLLSQKNYTFLIMSLLFFALSLYPLKIGALGNRMLVFLPFISIITAAILSKPLLRKNKGIKLLTVLVVVIIFSFQLFDSYKCFRFKLGQDQATVSSDWIVKNLRSGTTIGIENIPIYQFLPNVILKDFYLQEYKVNKKPIFSYKVVSYKDKLPNTVIVTNVDLESKFLIKSDKVKLVEKLDKEGYKIVKKFEQDFKYFPSLQDRFDFIFAALVPVPDAISIYEK